MYSTKDIPPSTKYLVASSIKCTSKDLALVKKHPPEGRMFFHRKYTIKNIPPKGGCSL